MKREKTRRGGAGDALFMDDGSARDLVSLRSPLDLRLEFVLEASVILSGSLDCETSLDRLARFLVLGFADWCIIDVLDEDGAPRFFTVEHADTAKLPQTYELRQSYPPRSNAEGLGRVLRTGESVVYPVISDENMMAFALDAKHLMLLREVGMTSSLVVALKVGERILGAMSLMLTGSDRRYSDVDLKVVEKIASHAALAIDNARLFAAEREARSKAERAARRLERLQVMTSALAAPLGTVEIGDLIVRETLAVLGAEGGVLATLAKDGLSLDLVDTLGYPEDLLARWKEPLPISLELPLCEAARTGKIVTWETAEESLGYYPVTDEQRQFAVGKGLLAAPLVFEGRVLGALGVTFAEPRRFSEEDLAFLETLAQQCAQALERERLSQAERRARWETDLLYTLVDAVSRAECLEDIFAPAMEAVGRALGTDRSSILLVDPDGVMRFKASQGLSESYCASLQASAPWSSYGADMPLLWGDVEHDAAIEAVEALRPVILAEGIRAFAGLPLFHQSTLIGRISSYAGEKRVFSSEAIRLATTMARQVAQAVGRRLSVAEIARLYAEAESAREAAQSANRMKDEFLAVVSHELRTPLAAISGWATVLKGPRGKDAAALAKGLDVIDRNAKAQATLIEDILDVSRIITGKLVVDPRPVSLLAIVGEALDTMRVSANAKGILVTFPCCGDAFMVVGDPDRLRQIAWNLLSNAIKFTPVGGRVEVIIERVDGGVALEVADNGRGIAPGFLPYVFERFRQADSSTTREDSGVGLGLAIVRHLVELHGGQVHVESAGLGEGATFRAVFPVRVLVPEPRLEPTTGTMEAHRDLSGVRVLLIDDQRDARELLAELLTSLGATVEVAGSGNEGIASLLRMKPDVVVSDIGMPSEDGYTLIRRVRDLPPPFRDIPALALTAYARREDADRARAAGFDCHLAKPTSPTSLAAALATLLDLHPRSSRRFGRAGMGLIPTQ